MQTNKQSKKKTAHIVSHTYWDREWRYPIWLTRRMLLEFMDELIEVLKAGIYPGFLLDGQVIPVFDYLDIRSDKAESVKKLIYPHDDIHLVYYGQILTTYADACD